MNILYRACASKNGYQASLLNILYKKGIFEKCTVITQPLDDKDYYDSEIYHEINAGYGYSCSYKKKYNLDYWPEVSGKILQDLKQYESYALNMSCRNHHMHLMFYDEMEYEYMVHVKFWNYILDTEKIQFVFFATTPHCMWEYVIYSLAKVKGIPTLIETVANIPGLNEVGTSLDNIGNNTAICYREKKYDDMCDYVREYYDSVFKRNDACEKTNKAIGLSKQIEWVNNLYHRPIYKRVFKYTNLKFLNQYHKHVFDEEYYRFNYNVQLLRRYKLKKKNYGDQNYYNRKIAIKSYDLDEKFIFFALQYFPESSVLPRAGVFWNQINSIRMLANVAYRCGIKVYVKEHWLEEGRPKRYYQQLKSINGVICIPSHIDSFKLIDKAIAVSSATGTCMQESIIKGKPVITFANHCLCGAPGVFRVYDETDINKILEMILNKQCIINNHEIQAYFSAMSRTLVKGYLDWPDNPRFNMDECIQDTVELISDFVNDGMKDSYIYIKNNPK